MADLVLQHRYVAGKDGSSATLLLLHGTGGDEASMLVLGAKLAPGLGALSPRGSVDEDGKPRFFRRLAPGVFDMDDLFARTRELAAFVRAASDRYAFDPARVIPVGYSNGANMAVSLILMEAYRFPVAILFRAMVPFLPEEPPSLRGLKAFVAAGRHDLLAPAPHTAKLVEILEGGGAAVTLNWESAGHNLTTRETNAAAEWLRQTI